MMYAVNLSSSGNSSGGQATALDHLPEEVSLDQVTVVHGRIKAEIHMYRSEI